MWHIIRKDLEENASTLALAILAVWLLWMGLVLLPWSSDGLAARSRAVVLLLMYAVPVLASMVGADSMARELDRDTLPLLLSRPVSRGRIWAAKWLSGLVLALALPLGLLLLVWLSSMISGATWPGGVTAALSAPIGHLTSPAFLLAGPGAARMQAGSSAEVPVSTLLLTVTCFSLTFLTATQIRRRLDAVMGGALASAVLLLAHRRLAMELGPLALMLTVSFAAAAYWTLRRGEALDSRARHVAAVSALAISLGVCLTAVQSLHWLETSVLTPRPARLSAMGPCANGSIFLTVATQPRWTNLFRTPDTRVAQVSLDTGLVTWLPVRWARCEQQDPSPLAPSAELSENPAGAVKDGRLELTAVGPNLGYPCGYAKPALYDLASRSVSWPGWGSHDVSVRTASGLLLRFRSGEPAGTGGLMVELSGAGLPAPEIVFSSKRASLVQAWRDGPGVAYLKSELARLVLVRHGPDGRETSATTLCELPSGTSSTTWVTVLLPPLDSISASGASSASTTADWKLVHASTRDARNRYRLTLVRPEGTGLASSELTGPILGHEPPQLLPGGGFLLYALEAGAEGDWHGTLARFDGRGAPVGRLDLGSHVRMSASRLSPDRGHLVAHLWTGKGVSDPFMLVDVEKLTLTPLQTGAGLPGAQAVIFRRLDEWLLWLDDRRLLHVTDRTVSLLDLDGGSPPRQLVSF